MFGGLATQHGLPDTSVIASEAKQSSAASEAR
jgi:hypothetical protein